MALVRRDTVARFPLFGALEVLRNVLIELLVGDLRCKRDRLAAPMLTPLKCERLTRTQPALVPIAMSLDIKRGGGRKYTIS